MANKARLIEVRDKILANKDRFYYAKWSAELDDLDCIRNKNQKELTARLEEDCNTCGCVAGWTYSYIPEKQRKTREYFTLQAQAKLWLGIDMEDYSFLFMGHAGHGLPTTQLVTATVWDAIQRLNLLIDIETEKETADAAQ